MNDDIQRCSREAAKCWAVHEETGDLMALMGYADWMAEIQLILEGR